MEEHNMLDTPLRSPIRKKQLWTIRFLIVSISFLILALILMGFDPRSSILGGDTSFLIACLHAFTAIFALGGFVMGLTERSYNKKKALLGALTSGVMFFSYLSYAVVTVYTDLHYIF